MAKDINKFTLYGDSILVICQMRKTKEPQTIDSPPILQRIIYQSKHLEYIEFYHVYRHHNTMADSLANQGVNLKQVTLIMDQDRALLSNIT